MAQKPVHEERLGRMKAVVWANDTQSGVRHNVTFARIYKDGAEWKDFDEAACRLPATAREIVAAW